MALFFGDKLIFLTDAQKKLYLKPCFFKSQFYSKAIVINNFINEDMILKRIKKKRSNIMDILYVGRLTKMKGFQNKHIYTTSNISIRLTQGVFFSLLSYYDA